MKKYRITEKHSFYKAGCEFIKKNNKEIEFTNNGWITLESWTRISLWLHDGWIEEIKKPDIMNVILDSTDYSTNRTLAYEYVFVLHNIYNPSKFVIKSNKFFNLEKYEQIPIDKFFEFYKEHIKEEMNICKTQQP